MNFIVNFIVGNSQLLCIRTELKAKLKIICQCRTLTPEKMGRHNTLCVPVAMFLLLVCFFGGFFFFGFFMYTIAFGVSAAHLA